MKTRDELIEECRQEAARAAGGDVVRASDGTVIFDVDAWKPTKADLEWVDEALAEQRIEVCVEVNSTKYRAELDGRDVSISRWTGPGGCWVDSGRGIWQGAINDCSADLGDDVYAALDQAIAEVL